MSPGLPKKNIKQVGGQPLVSYTIETAVGSSAVEEVFVSTESSDLAEVAREYGAKVPFLRPERLSRKNVLLKEVISHAVDRIGDDPDERDVTPVTPIVVLQPNIPFRRTEDITKAVSKFRDSDSETLISVAEKNDFYWEEQGEKLTPLFEERQVLREEVQPLYQETGSITMTTLETLREGTWVGGSPSYLVTDRLSSFTVNSLVDFWLAQQIAQGLDILFRVDGGGDLGMGKVYRSLTIAVALRDLFDCTIRFVSHENYPGGIELIRERGVDVTSVSSPEEELSQIDGFNPDIVFIDTKRTTTRYLQKIHEVSAAAVNLEDFDLGPDYADFVVNPQQKDARLKTGHHLVGPDYLIIRDEFLGQSPSIPEFATNVLITFGGSDPLNLTVKCIRALSERKYPFEYRAVLGPDYTHEETLRSLPDQVLSQFDFYRDVKNMGELMGWADIALSSGGRTAYELAATGTPSLVLAQNEGEIKRTKVLRQQDAIEFLGHGADASIKSVPERLMSLAEDRNRREMMSTKGRETVDGQGTRRILDLVHNMLVG